MVQKINIVENKRDILDDKSRWAIMYKRILTNYLSLVFKYEIKNFTYHIVS